MHVSKPEMRKLRISMIDPSLFTLPYDQELAKGLTECGHDVTLFGRRPGPDDGEAGGVRLVEAFYRIASSRPMTRLPGRLRLGVKGLDHLWSMVRLVPRLRRQAPDVIHFQWLPLPLVDGRLLNRFRRIAPLVLTVHDTNPFNGDPSSRLQARGFARCLDHFERLIVHTEQGHARMLAQGVPAERLVVLPHGMLGTPTRSQAPDPMQGEMNFVLFGKIKPYKGTDLLIEAFAMLPERLRSQARVRIIGKPYMDLGGFQEQIRRHGLAERVSIEPRFVPDDEISDIFGPDVVAAFPYREIDASGVLFQALSHGRPIVAARLGAFTERLQDGVQGHLVPPEDVAALSTAVGHLIEDRGFAAACSREALAAAGETMSWQAIAARSTMVYEEAIAALAANRRAAVGLPSAGRRRATEVSSNVRNMTGGNC